MAFRVLGKRASLALIIAGLVLVPRGAEAQRKVTDVVFEGNEAFKSSRLKSVTRVDNASIMGVIRIRPTFNYLVMARDVTYLRAFYRNRGYLQCTVEERTEAVGADGLVIHFTIHEGPLTALQRLEFVGNELFTDQQLRETLRRLRGVRLREGDPVNEAAIQAGAGEILRRYRGSGHYFATIVPSVGRRDSTAGAAPVIYRVMEGPVVRVSEVRIEGARTTKDKVIRREVTLAPGDLMTEEERRESQRRLYATGILRTVSVTLGEVSADSTSVVVLVTVSERPKRYVGTGVGMAGDEDNFDLRLRTSAQWGHRSIYGTGRAVELSANADFRVITVWELIRRELSLRYLEPWFLGSRTPLTAYVGLRPRSYELTDVEEVAAEIGVSREFSPRTRGWLNFAYRWIVLTDRGIAPIDIPLTAFTDRDRLRGFNGTLERDTRDNVLSPIRGSLARIRLSSYGILGLGGPSYSVGTFLWSRYQLTGTRTVLATRMQLGIAAHGSNITEVPIFDRFFAGGVNSVRGYQERMLGPMRASGDTLGGGMMPRGGEAMAVFNIEWRRSKYFGPFGLLLFLDAGDVWETISTVDIQRFACSAGVGLFLDTPIGPLRVEYGWRLNREKGGNIHYSVMYAF